MIYEFRHKTPGQLGCLVLQDSPDGLCHISSEVAGDPNAPMTQSRAQIFESLSQPLAIALESAVGKKQQPDIEQHSILASPASPKERITSKQIFCPRCGEVAALLILADQAREVAEIEDCARKTYSIYEELDVVT